MTSETSENTICYLMQTVRSLPNSDGEEGVSLKYKVASFVTLKNCFKSLEI